MLSSGQAIAVIILDPQQLGLPAHGLHKTGSINIHEAPLCPGELMVVHGCWERGSHF